MSDFVWKGVTFPTFRSDAIDELAPKCPVVYALVTPAEQIYVGASRNPKTRLKDHLTGNTFSGWLERITEAAVPIPDEWGEYHANWEWRASPGFKKLCRELQLVTRWSILQTFDRDAFAEDIGIAEKAWTKALGANLNSPDAKGTYSSGPSRGLGVQQIADGVTELIPKLHTMEPWQPTGPQFKPLTLIQHPKPVHLSVVDKPRPKPARITHCDLSRVAEHTVDSIVELVDLARWCKDNGHAPPFIDLQDAIDGALDLVWDFDSELAELNRHHRRGCRTALKPMKKEAA